MKGLRDSAEEALTEYRELIKFYQQNVGLYQDRLKGDLSETKRKCYEGLLDIARTELKNCQAQIKRILEGRYGQYTDEEWTQIQAETNKLLKIRKR